MKTPLALMLIAMLAGCSPTVAGEASPDTATTHAVTEPAASVGGSDATDAEVADAADSPFDPNVVHTITIDIPDETLTDVLQTYADSGDKIWAAATVTIDGVSYEEVGIKLKGNSSLRGVSATTAAETLPWRIRLDKYVDGQNAGGYTDFTVRGNSSATSMNEAVALDLLGDAGLATEQAAEIRFSVNGSAQTLRLIVQNLDETWVAQNFPDAGTDSILYKSDADGDWSWRGSDGDYTESFKIEAGPEDYSPLIDLLDLVNNGTADEIAEHLPELVDLDSFATYQAFEDLIGNFDDIDGPGNNSYLFWDSATGQFTVVAWDHNLAFGSSPGGMGRGGMGRDGMDRGAQEGRTRPESFPTDLPDDFPTDRAPGGNGFPGGDGMPGGGRMPGGGTNPLVKAVDSVSGWDEKLTAATADLTATLIDAGARDESVTRWQELLTVSATDLVDADTISQEADAIRSYQ